MSSALIYLARLFSLQALGRNLVRIAGSTEMRSGNLENANIIISGAPTACGIIVSEYFHMPIYLARFVESINYQAHEALMKGIPWTRNLSASL
jgi:hypothetical protein